MIYSGYLDACPCGPVSPSSRGLRPDTPPVPLASILAHPNSWPEPRVHLPPSGPVCPHTRSHTHAHLHLVRIYFSISSGYRQPQVAQVPAIPVPQGARARPLPFSVCAPSPSRRLGFHRPAEAQWVAGAPRAPAGCCPQARAPPSPPAPGTAPQGFRPSPLLGPACPGLGLRARAPGPAWRDESRGIGLFCRRPLEQPPHVPRGLHSLVSPLGQAVCAGSFLIPVFVFLVGNHPTPLPRLLGPGGGTARSGGCVALGVFSFCRFPCLRLCLGPDNTQADFQPYSFEVLASLSRNPMPSR